jgi:hypothetical protein
MYNFFWGSPFSVLKNNKYDTGWQGQDIRTYAGVCRQSLANTNTPQFS